MLEVVQQEQQTVVADRCRKRVLRPERLSGGGQDECGISERGERDPPDAAVVVVRSRGRSLQREPRLAAATRTGQRHQPDVRAPEQGSNLVDLPLAAEERRPRNGKVRLVQRLQRREVFRPELKEALGRTHVLQTVEAEIAHIDPGKVGGRLRQEHLPAVPGGRDPRRPVHVEPHVPLIGHERLAGVQPHPHADRATRERELRIRSGRHRVGRTREPDEERVALRVDLDPLVSPPRLPQRTAVLSERLCIPVAQFPEQPRRPLDVGEEERHRPGRELSLHLTILPRYEAWHQTRAEPRRARDVDQLVALC